MIRPGQFVRRVAVSPHPIDPFQCHPFSFGQVIDVVVESPESRNDNPDLAILGEDAQWKEVVVSPFDNRMSPKGDFWIQWTPDECVALTWWGILWRIAFWPVRRLFYRKPLAGQSTDWLWRRN